MKKPKRLDGKKKLVTLTAKLQSDMQSFCRTKGIESESELVRQAVAAYIYSDYTDETLKLQGLKQIQKKLSELQDMAELLFKYIRLMHINTLAYHPEIDSQFADAAFHSATMRHDKFFNAFRDSLKDDPPLLERLLHDFFTKADDGKN